MTNWNNLLEFYYDDMNRNLIGRLIEDYGNILQEDDYQAFSFKSEEQLLSDIYQINATWQGGDEDHPFLYAFADFLRYKASNISEEGTRAFEEYLNQFEAIDQLYVKELLAYYKDKDYAFARLKNGVELKDIVKDIAGLTFPYIFWEGFVRSLKLRIEKLKETSPEEAVQQFREYFPYGEREQVNHILDPIYEADPYFSLYSLSRSEARKFARDVSAHFAHSEAIKSFSNLFIKRLQHVQEENYAEAEFMAALLKLYPAAMQEGVKALVEALLKEYGVEKISHLSEYLSPESIHKAIDGFAANHPFFLGMAAWLIEAAKAFVENNSKPADVFVPARKAVTGKLNSGNTDKLANYLVKVKNAETSELLDQAITQANGYFTFSFLPPFHVLENGEIEYLPITVTYEISALAAPQEIIESGSEEIAPEQTYLEIETAIAEPEVPVTPVNTLAENGLIDIAEDTQTLLDGITLQDIRLAGGIANLIGKEELDTIPEKVRLDLDAHARLEAFSPDLAVNGKAIANGYDSIGKITANTRDEFAARSVGENNADSNAFIEAAILHQQAVNAEAFSQALEILSRSAEASSYKVVGGSSPAANARMALTPENAAQKCNCDGCQTAVSPSAYLNALLDYTKKHVKQPANPARNNSREVFVADLTTYFKQQFAELASYCQEATEKHVCQIRVAIETIRRYIVGISPANPDLTDTQKLPYLSGVYDSLLLSLGTSAAELAEVFSSNGSEKVEAQNKLAQRTGLDVAFMKDKLHLTINGSGRKKLNEKNLEILFGLQDTTRNPFNSGVLINNPLIGNVEALSKWNFEGVEWLKNTDENGYLYILIEVHNPGEVNVYKSDTYPEHVGKGKLTPMSLTTSGQPADTRRYAKITPVNGSGLYGELYFNNASVANGSIHLQVSAIPEVAAHRLKKQEQSFTGQPINAAFNGTVIIDPDLISPDDIRHYNINTAPGGKVYEVWMNRRNWLDNFFTSLISAESLEELFDKAVTVTDYSDVDNNDYSFSNRWNVEEGLGMDPATTHLDAIKTLYTTFSANNTDSTTLEAIQTFFGFTVDSFIRLNELLDKLTVKEEEGEMLTAEDLGEAAHILTQTLKYEINEFWLAEELILQDQIANDPLVNAASFSLFSPIVFQTPIHEPAEGIWDNRKEGVPFIDPDLVTVKDLPDPVFGEYAIETWQARKDAIETERKAILNAKGSGTAETQSDNMFKAAYGIIPVYTPAFSSMTEVYEALSLTSSPKHQHAKDYITDKLALKPEEFNIIMGIRQKVATDKDWELHAALLTAGWKRKTAYLSWIDKEAEDDLKYWQVLKQRLVKWRASAVKRNAWKDALLLAVEAPIIDPDQLGDADFLHPELDGATANDNVAYEIYVNRKEEVDSWFYDVQTDPPQVLPAGVDLLAYQVNRNLFGLSVANSRNNDGLDELKELHALKIANVDVTARLNQLGLNSAALVFILDNEVKYNATANDAIRAEISHIFVQCKKQQFYSIWQAEEAAAGIVLSSTYFKIPFEETDKLNAYEEAILLPWRSSRRSRQEWQNLLRDRIEQRSNLVAQLVQAVEDAEDRHLITLRDALIGFKINTGNARATLEEKANWLSDKLLLDFNVSCCQKTTRLAQAIGVLQQMYFLIRNGQNTFSGTTLTIDLANLEQDWNWLGSYEGWRSLMFVYLYPENLLQPSYKPVQTEKFREIVQHTRQNLKLTPEDACYLMHEYEDYMQEISSLQLQAACRTYTEKKKDGCAVLQTLVHEVNFQFAVSSKKKAYYNAYIEENSQTYKIKDWKSVPGLGKVEWLVGATPYKLESGDRFLYVFAVISKQEETKEKDDKKEAKGKAKGKLILAAARLNLQTQVWGDEIIEFELPDEDKILFDQLVIGERSSESDVPVLYGLKNKTLSFWRRKRFVHKWRPFKDDLGNDLWNHHLFSIPLEREGVKLAIDNIIETPIRSLSSLKLHAVVSVHRNSSCYIFSYRVSSNEETATRIGYCLRKYADNRPIYGQYNDVLSRISLQEPRRAELKAYLDAAANSSNSASNNYSRDYVFSIIESLQMPIKDLRILGITCDLRLSELYRFKLTFSKVSTNEIVTKEIKFDYDSPNYSNYPHIVISNVARIVPGNVFSTNIIGPCFQFMKTGSVLPKYIVYQSAGPGNTIFISTTVPTRLLPDLSKKFQVLSRLDKTSQQTRKSEIAAIFTNNAIAEKEFLAYPQEAYYFLPMHFAFELQKNKHYEEALKYFRLVFDYLLPIPAISATSDPRKIYHGLEQEASPTSGSDLYNKALNWLDNPDNPHAIAALRANSYTRFTLISIVRCLTEYADQEFTRDTVESVPRAKELYELAKSLLTYEMETFEYESCEALLSQVDALVTDVRWKPEWERLKEMLRAIGLKNEIRMLLEDGFSATGPNGTAITYRPIIRIFELSGTWENKIEEAEAAIEARMAVLPNMYTNAGAIAATTATPPLARLGVTNQDVDGVLGQLAYRTAANYNDTLHIIADQLPYADFSWLASDDLEVTVKPPSTARAKQSGTQYNFVKPVMQLHTSGILNRPYVPFLGASFCVPNNPVPYSMYLYIQLSLFKIRNCMNIAGMKRELDPYAAPTDATSGMPMIGANGRLTFPGKLVVPATQYRYAVLVERTKQLVNIAQQVEAALLSALEKRDAEYYSKLKARQDIQTGKATVKLQDLRITEAKNGVDLARLQKERSQIMETTYQGWIDAGLNGWENAMIENYYIAAFANSVSAALGNIISVNNFTEAYKIPMAIAKSYTDIVGIMANTSAQVASIQSAHARRVDEWTLQKNLATHDLKIGDQQIKLSQDRVKITGQEKVISELQLTHSEDTMNFLLTKFTNADLYDWMSRVLEGVYNYFLQQATAMAKLAELQLAFERQESPQGMILSDYWTAPAENLSYDPDAAKPADRKGLTGSVRLLQDVTKLDQYAFDTNKRKLQLTKTLSLAQLFPAEFAVFKQTGRMPFTTLQTWFDRDFPGHYLRVIRKVRTSVIALVPPTDGIKATLQTTGISRVVINGQQPQTAILPRQPELVALTSPMNATGLFEMEQQPGELLFPFEGMGVEANWEFRMERASNMMDFSTIADVLISIDYTAMESFTHAQTIKAGFANQKMRLERSFSFRNNFADQWYDLHHAQATANPYSVSFDIHREDFPANLKDLRIKSLSLLVDLDVEHENDKIGHDVTLKRSQGAAVTASTNTFGLISTRTGSSGSSSAYKIYSGNSAQWTSLFTGNSNPVDTWTLSITQNSPLAQHFANGKVNDLVFIVEFEGEGPEFLKLT
ncbi:hypothetical protein I5M27_09980 [Adhaeribacter sp. BT258]|uniref:Virulence plasmid A protein n=1 Tax=Adhaeribacter terrigena TaxID=2793070 RepID=A0ABS1C1Q9_9BACT|nr:neuraminidase-like domain-containing protein [Adhaeribacter terrigena]MBK0403315.1 hypothetical protein [Adhaeribacter terrigena]